jgi:phosphonate transport system permease protein
MSASTQSVINASNSKAQPIVSPEELRERLLSPWPKLGLRAILLIVFILLIVGWSVNASRPTEVNRIKGVWDVVYHMADLVSRMLPPTFELVDTTKVTYNILGADVTLGWPVIIGPLIETIQMAIVGTIGAVLMALPLSLLAARNVSPHPSIYQGTRLVLNFMRSIPELVWAVLFAAGVGLGPFAGVLALAFGAVGSLARVYAEAIEQIDPQQVMALRATGANPFQTFRYGVIPQAFPLFISYSIVYFESNVRHSTILGLVGAGGIGFYLFYYTNIGNYQLVLGTTIALVLAVTVIDRISSNLRQRFI